MSAMDCAFNRPACESSRGERGDFVDSWKVGDTVLVVAAVVDARVLVVVLAPDVLASVAVMDECDFLLKVLDAGAGCDARRFRVSRAFVSVGLEAMPAVVPLPDWSTFGNGEAPVFGASLIGEGGWLLLE
jgi:hypothetical protein